MFITDHYLLRFGGLYPAAIKVPGDICGQLVAATPSCKRHTQVLTWELSRGGTGMTAHAGRVVNPKLPEPEAPVLRTLLHLTSCT